MCFNSHSLPGLAAVTEEITSSRVTLKIRRGRQLGQEPFAPPMIDPVWSRIRALVIQAWQSRITAVHSPVL